MSSLASYLLYCMVDLICFGSFLKFGLLWTRVEIWSFTQTKVSEYTKFDIDMLVLMLDFSMIYDVHHL